jgi:hypothetical protein
MRGREGYRQLRALAKDHYILPLPSTLVAEYRERSGSNWSMK